MFALVQEKTQPRTGHNLIHLATPLVWLIFPLTLCLAITRQSLWIDEGFTVWFASHSDLQSFFRNLIGSRGAPGDPQFIFYLLHMWAWIKIFGASELSLRAANIPFAVIFASTMSWASRRLFWSKHLWVIFCLSPFFWFYLNEARAYAALLAFSSVASAALVAYLVDPDRYRRNAPWYCVLGLFLAWGVHILAFFLFPVFLILVGLTLGGRRALWLDFFRHWTRPILYSLPAFLALGAFYLCVSANGVNKSEGQPGLANFAFALYEFAGFAGLGPPRNDIRQNPSVAVFLPYWPWLLLGAFAVLAVTCFVLRRPCCAIRRNLFVSAMCGLALAVLVSRLQHFQVLGRHMATLFPVLLMVGMLGPRRNPVPEKIPRMALASLAALGVVWAISDGRLVLLNQYKKDSYREACAIALAKSQQEGALIIWAADAFTAHYYGVTVDDIDLLPSPNPRINPAVLGRVVSASTWNLDQAVTHIATSSVPTVLVLSRPDTFDPDGTWRALIREEQPVEVARLNAVSIFEWRPRTIANCSGCPRPPAASEDLLVRNTSNSTSSTPVEPLAVKPPVVSDAP